MHPPDPHTCHRPVTARRSSSYLPQTPHTTHPLPGVLDRINHNQPSDTLSSPCARCMLGVGDTVSRPPRRPGGPAQQTQRPTGGQRPGNLQAHSGRVCKPCLGDWTHLCFRKSPWPCGGDGRQTGPVGVTLRSRDSDRPQRGTAPWGSSLSRLERLKSVVWAGGSGGPGTRTRRTRGPERARSPRGLVQPGDTRT